MLEYKRQIDLLRTNLTNEHVKLAVKDNESYFSTFKSTIAKFLTQELIIKFNIGLDKIMIQNLINPTDSDSISVPNHHEMYSECYLMKVPVPNWRIKETVYFNLLATLHCMFMNQSQIYDASIIVIEFDSNLIVGFALRSYLQLILSQFYKRRECRHISLKIPIIPSIKFDNIDRILTREIEIMKQYLVTKRPKQLLKQEESLISYLEKPDLLTFEVMKSQICAKGASVISLIAKLNDTQKTLPTPKIYTSKKLQLKKGNYPSEQSLLNGVVFTVLNSDELYTSQGQCLVIMPPDLADSDDLVIYLIIERTKNKLVSALDLTKKSDVQVGLTQLELSIRGVGIGAPTKIQVTKTPSEEESKISIQEQVREGNRQIEEMLTELQTGKERVDKAKEARVTACLQMFQEYKEKVGSYAKYKERVDKMMQENWNRVFQKGTLNTQSKILGNFFLELMDFKNGLIRDIYESLLNEEDNEKQNLLIEILSTSLFCQKALGDVKIAMILKELYSSYRTELWAQHLILQILQDNLLGKTYALKLALDQLNEPGFLQILANQTKELNLSPSSYIYQIQGELFKHRLCQQLFLISDIHLISLIHILKHYTLHTIRPIVSETVLAVVQKKSIRSEDESFIIVDATSNSCKDPLDTRELDELLERLENGQDDENNFNVYEAIDRCQEIKQVSDQLIIDNEAVNKSIISINYSNQFK